MKFCWYKNILENQVYKMIGIAPRYQAGIRSFSQFIVLLQQNEGYFGLARKRLVQRNELFCSVR